MDRGFVRMTRLRLRLMIVLTITGVALAALLPTVRSAPGLSRSPRCFEPPMTASIAFVEDDAFLDGDETSFPCPTGSGRIEDDLNDFGELVEEAMGLEWLAVRPSRGRTIDRVRLARESIAIDLRALASIRPRPLATTGTPGTGLPIALCRLLI